MNNTTFPFDATAVQLWSDRYWSDISATNRIQQRGLEAEMPRYRMQQHLDKRVFMTLGMWKSPRPKPRYERNTEQAITDITRRAFIAKRDADGIQVMTRLHGVAQRTASAMLHWMCPDRYPILDIHVLWGLGMTPPASWERPEIYARVANRMRTEANRLDSDLRTLDRAVWTWSRNHH